MDFVRQEGDGLQAPRSSKEVRINPVLTIRSRCSVAEVAENFRVKSSVPDSRQIAGSKRCCPKVTEPAKSAK